VRFVKGRTLLRFVIFTLCLGAVLSLSKCVIIRNWGSFGDAHVQSEKNSKDYWESVGVRGEIVWRTVAEIPKIDPDWSGNTCGRATVSQEEFEAMRSQSNLSKTGLFPVSEWNSDYGKAEKLCLQEFPSVCIDENLSVYQNNLPRLSLYSCRSGGSIELVLSRSGTSF
jgi:hypothetical protein